MQDRGEGLPVPKIGSVILQKATLLWHLSSCRIVHADVGPDNNMVAHGRRQPIGLRLIDFGLASPFGEQPFFPGAELQERCQAFTSSLRLNIGCLWVQDECYELKTQDYACPRYQETLINGSAALSEDM